MNAYDVLRGFRRYPDHIVIEAIDVVMVDYDRLDKSSQDEIRGLLYAIKMSIPGGRWVITDVKKSLFDHMGFYADMVLWQGWHETLLMKSGIPK